MYQLKITLLRSDPSIWRRVLVPSDIKLDRLNRVIQLAMGWENCHWHEFTIGQQQYTLPQESTPAFWLSSLAGGPRDERTIHLDQLIPKVTRTFTYEYDFGDSWQHQIEFEDVVPASTTDTAPTCIDGQRACPPEDCGGIDRYHHLLKVMKRPKRDRERRELIDWLGEELDPVCFETKLINEELHALSIDGDFSPF
jgi:hypothetical protein